MTIAIYGSRHQHDHVDSIISFLGGLVKESHRLVLHKKIADYLAERCPLEALAISESSTIVSTPEFAADVAVSIGGDGTFLRTAQWVSDKEIPIIGVNTGHLGFLAPFTLAEARAELESFIHGRSLIDERSLLQVNSPELPADAWPYALNEVAILKKDSASMIEITTSLERLPIADYLCDGLIVSTPTGSTGYNLSAGGPVVDPASPVLILSPVAAHSLTMRPLVIPDSHYLTFKVTCRHPQFRLSLDGRSYNFSCGHTFYVSKAPFAVRYIVKSQFAFYNTIREKLLWGTTPRRTS